MRKLISIAAAGLLAGSGAATAQDMGPNDAQIAHIAYTAGQIDADAARQAIRKSRNSQVIAFARTMLRDHVAVNDQALALVRKLNVTPQANPTSAALSSQAAAKMRSLSSLKGRAFDLAYARNEAEFHRNVNTALKTQLIPGADNAELKALLESGLALFGEHQNHAEQLARQLQ